MNVHKQTPGQRIRLLSEGSHPHSDQSPVIFKAASSSRERHHSGQNPRNSQPGTPVHYQQKLSVCPPNQFFPANFVAYGTAPRNEHPSIHAYQQRQFDPVLPSQGFQNATTVAYTPQQQVYVQRPPKVQRQISEPQSRAQVGRSYSTSMKYPPNYYPSLQQERNPLVPVHHSHEQPKHLEKAGPINHYPSLPHRSSAAPYGENNSYMMENGFERPATLYKREKMPSVMRQASTPNASRGGVYVPPPSIPNNGLM